MTVLLVSLFSGCVSTQDRIESLLQTSAATVIKNDYKNIAQQLIVFKDKLDKRNPKSYDKELAPLMYTQINELENKINLKYGSNEIGSYKEYLQIAFSKTDIQNRDDYLILGMYKLMYDAYDIQDGHRVSAFSYNEEKLQRLFHNLQILKWKIKTAKDLKEEYLFLTWQNNWQIELEKRVRKGEKPTFEELQNLEYIKNNKESLFSSSNTSFEVILTQMIQHVKNSLETLGVEPVDMGIEAIKSVFIFL